MWDPYLVSPRFVCILAKISPRRASPPLFTHEDERGQAQLPDSARREERLHVPQRRPLLRGSSDRDQPEEGVHLRDAAERGDRRDTSPVRGREEHLHAEGRPQGGLLGEPEKWGAVRRCWQGEVQEAGVRLIFKMIRYYFLSSQNSY